MIHCSDAWMQSGQYSMREIVKMNDQIVARLQQRSLAEDTH